MIKKGDKVKYARLSGFYGHKFHRQHYDGIVTRVYDRGHRANILCDGYPEMKGIDMWWLIPLGGLAPSESMDQMKGHPTKPTDARPPLYYEDYES